MYHALWYERDRHPVHTAVIYSGPVRIAPDTLDFGSGTYRVQNVFLGQRDGDGELATLQHERAMTGALSTGAAIRVAMRPLLCHRQRSRVEVAVTALELAESFPEDPDREAVAAAVVLLVERFLKPSEMARLMEVFGMSRIGDMLLEKGKAEGKAEDILLVLRRGFGSVPDALARRVLATADLATLDRWLSTAVDVASLSDFERVAVCDRPH